MRGAVDEHVAPALGGLRHDFLQLGSARFAVRIQEPCIHKNILQELLVGAKYSAILAEVPRQCFNRCFLCVAIEVAAQKQLALFSRPQVRQ